MLRPAERHTNHPLKGVLGRGLEVIAVMGEKVCGISIGPRSKKQTNNNNNKRKTGQLRAYIIEHEDFIYFSFFKKCFKFR